MNAVTATFRRLACSIAAVAALASLPSIAAAAPNAPAGAAAATPTQATAPVSVDANRATQAELESLRGVGPSLAGKIVAERQKGAFRDWPDMIARVTGVGEKSAMKLSSAGLQVAGAGYVPSAAPAAPATPPAAPAKAPAATKKPA